MRLHNYCLRIFTAGCPTFFQHVAPCRCILSRTPTDSHHVNTFALNISQPYSEEPTRGVYWRANFGDLSYLIDPWATHGDPKAGARHMAETVKLRSHLSCQEKLSHFAKVLSLPLLSQYTPESRQKYIELQALPPGLPQIDGNGKVEATWRAPVKLWGCRMVQR